MKKYSLEFCFKGSRNYVHGTDIFNKVIKQLKNEMLNKKIDLSFHGIARTNIDLVNEKPENKELIKFAIKFINKDNKKEVMYGIENGKKIECRYEYPEENIYNLSNLNLEKKEVVLNKDTSFSFIENVIALNKYLLVNLFSNANGKWYFTRLQLKENIDSNYPLKLILKGSFNLKLTKTEIFVDNKSVGFIYFSLV
jgi:hypothetical protein